MSPQTSSKGPDRASRPISSLPPNEETHRALRQLTGGIAHDYNNLLTVVTSAAEMLCDEPNMARPEREDLLSAILSAAATGRDINRGLLAYAQQLPLQPRFIDVSEHVLANRRLFEQCLGPEIELSLDVEHTPTRVDPNQLTSMLRHVLTNARDASASTGRVEISTHSVEDKVVIEVVDHGTGMSREAIRRALEPFYSTRVTSAASGLGLSSAYGFIRQSGGDMEIESAPGVGTSVRLELPKATPGPQSLPASNADKD